MVFVDIKNDVAFRKIFGDHQKTEVLISFLNAVLETKGDKIITKVSILNPFQLAAYGIGKTSKHTDDDGLKEAYSLAKRYSWSKTELEAYEYAEMRAQDERGKMEVALAKANKEGMEKGVEKVAIKLLKKGMDVDFVIDATGLSREKVEELIKEHL